MKKLLFLFLVFGCSDERGEIYFDFDEIEYYVIDSVSEIDLIDISIEVRTDSNNTRTELEILKSAIIIGEEPETLKDSAVIGELINIGFERKPIRRNRVKDFFRERKDTIAMTALCGPVYRDILVFKKQNKISGIAKICFSCDKHHIIGSQLETWNFGQSGDYKLLEEELKRE